jgi:hydrogenase nickel incorporation protein HypA/HybF
MIGIKAPVNSIRIMHELSLCLALIEQVQSIANEHGATRVERILLHIGPLSGVEPPLLENAYPLAANGTIAAEAILDIEITSVRVRCTECGAETSAEPNRLLCGQCGGFRTRVVSGDEMLLTNLELTVPDSHGDG